MADKSGRTRGLKEPWQKGQSGNPSGKPKGTGKITKKLIQDIDKPAKSVLTAKEIKQLRLPPDATCGDAFVHSLLIEAITSPSSKAAMELINRIDGKVQERLEVEANFNSPLEMWNVDLSKLDAEDLKLILELQRKCRPEESPET